MLYGRPPPWPMPTTAASSAPATWQNLLPKLWRPAHESHDGSVEVRKALQNVRDAAHAADEAFSAVLIKVTEYDKVAIYRAEVVSNAAGDTAVLCLDPSGPRGG